MMKILHSLLSVSFLTLALPAQESPLKPLSETLKDSTRSVNRAENSIERVTPPPISDRIPTRNLTREDLQKRMADLRNRVNAPPQVPDATKKTPVKRVPAKQLEAEARSLIEGQPAPERKVVQQKAREIATTQQAESLVNTILGVAPKPAVANRPDQVIRRLDASETGRTISDRQNTVTAIVNQFLGAAPVERNATTARAASRVPSPPKFHLHEGNRRVVRYANRAEIPPILLATSKLNRVDVRPVGRADYLGDSPERFQNVPATYQDPKAYAVSYQVDPRSVVTRDDILFRQGSTAFADAYSYDIVADLAEAMLHSRLRGEEFVIEGHASAEGSYELNLDLSQRRAERIARDLVGYGVDPNRLIPVGYGETEARYPGNAQENLRALDRRVMVFRLE